MPHMGLFSLNSMSLESDQATVLAAFPNAHLVTKTSSGGMKIVEHVIRSGMGDDPAVGPQAFSVEKAWRYAAERLERQEGIWRE